MLKLEELDVGQVVETSCDDGRWYPAEVTYIGEFNGPMTPIGVRVAYDTGIRAQGRMFCELRDSQSSEGHH